MDRTQCNDPVVGGILSGWRYDISGLSPAMRTDYEHHLHECGHCRRRQTVARTWDVLLLAVSTLSMVSFLLMSVLMRRIEAITHIPALHVVHLHQAAITISLQAVTFGGLLVSMVLCVLVAIATPLPGFLSNLVQERIPDDLRERFTRHA